MSQFYKQCLMCRETPEGAAIVEYHTAWIPEQFAQTDKIIDLKDAGEDGGWSRGWKVINVYGRAAEEYVIEHERDYKHQRKASDI